MSRTTYEVLELVYALKRHKNTIYGVGLLFLITFVLTYLLLYFNVEYVKEFGNILFNYFSKSIDATNLINKSSLELFSIILPHNLIVAFLMYVAMILSILIIAINAFLIAYVLYMTEPLKFILLIAPHGIFEIPAMILSASSGLLLFKSLREKLRKNNRYDLYYKDSLRLFVISIILFVISAIVESTITFEIAKIIH
jgi:uncharacterized membrane protein SpoIIM required for sporulation